MALVPVEHRLGLPQNRGIAFVHHPGGLARIAKMPKPGQRPDGGGIGRRAHIHREHRIAPFKAQKYPGCIRPRKALGHAGPHQRQLQWRRAIFRPAQKGL